MLAQHDVSLGATPGTATDRLAGLDGTPRGCDEDLDTLTHAPNHETCADGLFCNGPERCDLAQGCVAGTSPIISDELDCTSDGCDEDLDIITHAPNHGACGDGLFCNGPERCDLAQGCVAGTPPIVNDGLDCTSDGCDEDLDIITHLRND